MSIRRNGIVYVVLFLALGGTSYAASQLARAPHSCNAKGSTTIAQDAVGRFYSVTVRNRSAPRGRTSWYVCAFNHGTSRIVYRATSYGRAGSPFPFDPSAKVSGRYVAYVVIGGPNPCGGFFSVQVADMITGRSTFREGPSDSDFAPICGATLVLKANGSVAWISGKGSQTGTTWYVHRHDLSGTALIDSGPRIAPHSLAAGGQWLYWTDAGSPRSAPFR